MPSNRPNSGGGITVRLDAALDALRKERSAHDEKLEQERGFYERETQSRLNRLEEMITVALKKLDGKLDANTELTGQILLQTTKTNGRVNQLEDKSKNLKDDADKLFALVTKQEDATQGLRTDRTRFIQTISVVCGLLALLWMLFSDDIKARLSRPKTLEELIVISEQVVEKKVLPSSIKPKQP